VQTHKELCDGVVNLAQRVQEDQQLTSLIRRKFAIKCTTGGGEEGTTHLPVCSCALLLCAINGVQGAVYAASERSNPSSECVHHIVYHNFYILYTLFRMRVYHIVHYTYYIYIIIYCIPSSDALPSHCVHPIHWVHTFASVTVTGYSLNALVDFPTDNPIEIIKHLMIGSEGTFGFVSQVCARVCMRLCVVRMCVC
jgi:hypothetical protein